MVFNIDLLGRTPFPVSLALPTTQYELMDALEKIHSDSSHTDVSLESIEISKGFPDLDYLPSILPEKVDLYDLNHLASVLENMEQWELDGFVGLTMMDTIKTGYAPISVERLINMAASADNCQILYGATNDYELGRSYVDNGMSEIPEDLPESIYQLLDYDAIGKKARVEEKGVFTPKGYVLMGKELSQDYHTGDAAKTEQPNYTMRLQVTLKGAINACSNSVAYLDLPVNAEQLYKALQEVGASSVEDCALSYKDGIVPSLLAAVDETLKEEKYNEVNEMARNLMQLRADDKIADYKATLQYIDPYISFEDALLLSGQMEKYALSRNIATAYDYAREKLMQGKTAPMDILPYVNLKGYGELLLRQNNSALTEYGVLVPITEQTEQQDWEEAPGMQMQ